MKTEDVLLWGGLITLVVLGSRGGAGADPGFGGGFGGGIGSALADLFGGGGAGGAGGADPETVAANSADEDIGVAPQTAAVVASVENTFAGTARVSSPRPYSRSRDGGEAINFAGSGIRSSQVSDAEVVGRAASYTAGFVSEKALTAPKEVFTSRVVAQGVRNAADRVRLAVTTSGGSREFKNVMRFGNE